MTNAPKSLDAYILEALRAPMPDGRPTAQAIADRLVERAVAGDPGAVKLVAQRVLAILRRVAVQIAQAPPPHPPAS